MGVWEEAISEYNAAHPPAAVATLPDPGSSEDIWAAGKAEYEQQHGPEVIGNYALPAAEPVPYTPSPRDLAGEAIVAAQDQRRQDYRTSQQAMVQAGGDTSSPDFERRLERERAAIPIDRQRMLRDTLVEYYRTLTPSQRVLHTFADNVTNLFGWRDYQSRNSGTLGEIVQSALTQDDVTGLAAAKSDALAIVTQEGGQGERIATGAASIPSALLELAVSEYATGGLGGTGALNKLVKLPALFAAQELGQAPKPDETPVERLGSMGEAAAMGGAFTAAGPLPKAIRPVVVPAVAGGATYLATGGDEDAAIAAAVNMFGFEALGLLGHAFNFAKSRYEQYKVNQKMPVRAALDRVTEDLRTAHEEAVAARAYYRKHGKMPPGFKEKWTGKGMAEAEAEAQPDRTGQATGQATGQPAQPGTGMEPAAPKTAIAVAQRLLPGSGVSEKTPDISDIGPNRTGTGQGPGSALEDVWAEAAARYNADRPASPDLADQEAPRAIRPSAPMTPEDRAKAFGVVDETMKNLGAVDQGTSKRGSRYYELPDGRPVRVSDHEPSQETRNWADAHAAGGNDVLDLRVDQPGGMDALQFEEPKNQEISHAESTGTNVETGGQEGEQVQGSQEKVTANPNPTVQAWRETEKIVAWWRRESPDTLNEILEKGDPDRRTARYLERRWDDLPEHLQDFWNGQRIRDLETGEMNYVPETGIRGGHVWQVREYVEDAFDLDRYTPPVVKPSLTTPPSAKEPWQMTAAEYRRAENQPKVNAIHEALARGTPIILTTQTRATKFTKPEQIKLSDDGTVRIMAGNKWPALTDDYVDQLAAQAGVRPVPFDQRVYHKALIEEAVAEGKPVPPEVLADYPDLAKSSTPPLAEAVQRAPGAPPGRPTMQRPSEPVAAPAEVWRPPSADSAVGLASKLVTEWGKKLGYEPSRTYAPGEQRLFFRRPGAQTLSVRVADFPAVAGSEPADFHVVTMRNRDTSEQIRGAIAGLASAAGKTLPESFHGGTKPRSAAIPAATRPPEVAEAVTAPRPRSKVHLSAVSAQAEGPKPVLAQGPRSTFAQNLPPQENVATKELDRLDRAVRRHEAQKGYDQRPRFARAQVVQDNQIARDKPYAAMLERRSALQSVLSGQAAAGTSPLSTELWRAREAGETSAGVAQVMSYLGEISPRIQKADLKITGKVYTLLDAAKSEGWSKQKLERMIETSGAAPGTHPGQIKITGGTRLQQLEDGTKRAVILLAKGHNVETALHEAAHTYYGVQPPEWQAETNRLLDEFYNDTGRQIPDGGHEEAYAETAAGAALSEGLLKRVGIRLREAFSGFRDYVSRVLLPRARMLREALRTGKLKAALRERLQAPFERDLAGEQGQGQGPQEKIIPPQKISPTEVIDRSGRSPEPMSPEGQDRVIDPNQQITNLAGEGQAKTSWKKTIQRPNGKVVLLTPGQLASYVNAGKMSERDALVDMPPESLSEYVNTKNRLTKGEIQRFNDTEVTRQKEAVSQEKTDANFSKIDSALTKWGAVLVDESESGSWYYKFPDGKQVRVADHAPNPPTQNWIDTNKVISVRADEGSWEEQLDEVAMQVSPEGKSTAPEPGKQDYQLQKIAPQDNPEDIERTWDEWWAERDEKTFEARRDAGLWQQRIKMAVGEKLYGAKAKRADEVIALYIDLKGKHHLIDKQWEKLSNDQQELIADSQDLPPALKAIAEEIIVKSRAAGDEAMKEGVLGNVVKNYSMRLWKRAPKGKGDYQRFLKTSRAKPRTYNSTIDGWAEGQELAVKGATTAYELSRTDVSDAIADKHMMKLGMDRGLFSTVQEEPNWVMIDHPNFRMAKYLGTLSGVSGEIHGRNVVLTPSDMSGQRDVFEYQQVWTPPALGEKLNNALHQSSLTGRTAAWLTRWNRVIKHTILTTSLFHPMAFIRSYSLGTKTSLKNLRPIQAMADGKAAMEAFTPELRELVRGGLTLGRMQDWEERRGDEQTTWIGRQMDKMKVTREIKGKILALAELQTNWVFKRVGAQMKAQAGLLEYRHLLQKHAKAIQSGHVTRESLAKLVANLMNDDFGGLHLQRMGRNPTFQHLFQLAALAPDWTESNVRTVVKMFQRGEAGQVYRAFWGRVIAKGLTATIIFNLLLAELDDEDFFERYRRAWKSGGLKWLDVDITPIYRALGGRSPRRKYFSLIGHFKDPLKFVVHPLISAQHKGSVLTSWLADVLTGSDWTGRRFTTWQELLGLDDKGVYKTTNRLHHLGQRKGGKLAGQTVSNSRLGRRATGYEQVPSFLLNRVRSSMPIPVQNGLAFLAGEMDAFDAVLKSMGFLITTGYEDEQQEKQR